MTAMFPTRSATTFQPHPLHGPDRAWPETNCYVDLWIEVLAAYGVAPEAMLGFTLTQDFEGDQFTFFKVPLEDLESLYGITTTELSLYDTVENHVTTQLERGRLCLVEMDSFHLPDTAGITYRTEHGKTTVGINRLDSAAKTMEYFHNAGYFALSGADYEGVFQHAIEPGLRWIPYTEFAKFPATVADAEAQRTEARRLLAHHLRRRPSVNPLATFAAQFGTQVEQVAERGMDFFHLYAFNTVRQFGANFELLATHLNWLDAEEYAAEAAAAKQICDNAKTTQFMLARAVARRRFDALTTALDPSVAAWEAIITGLSAKVS
ncbi:DUF1839 family protein [Propionicimonas sp.]|uniref:DUF1839 family protein n=1 Tax=Propionicimonas sp. TaxID=1955623 RepID=UPI0017FA855D|nr:DUF1839 family protein [Propionicimonas sp.]MBU3976974.1 DUF1839 family protein [Actinomycetota bacterium]MBA3020545.1 DUF1839 family protein [Propionicimonas sp.]MBU3986719.1 DUF1839 family protein [Actinomycetota bacterium]MBU4007129.1 DUF1839 family protein [Actinomycetota bacterium]MBU4064882.1 DUF1839 family protein [Actinomycetota bacterium]